MSRYKAIFLAALLLSLGAAPALAHKINLSARSEQGVVQTRSTFHGGKPVPNGKVQVFDDRKNLLFEGKTNGQGEFEFSLPAVEEFEIVVNDGMGHRTTIRLNSQNLKEGK